MKYLYKYPQAEFPYARLVEENRGRSKTLPEFELVDTGVFDEVPLLRRRRRVRQGRGRRPPDPDQRQQPRPGGGAHRGAADALVPQHLELGARRPPPVDRGTTGPGRRRERDDRHAPRPRRVRPLLLRRRRAALHRERDERREAVRRPVPDPVRQGRLPRLRRERPARGREPGPHGDEGRRALRPDRRRRRDDHPRAAPGLACATGSRSRRPLPASTPCSPSAGRKRTSSTTSSCPPSSPRTPGWWRARPSRECSGPSSSTTTSSTTGWKATRPCRARRPSACDGRNHQWTHLHARDVISMPDKWEFPWFAAWDLGFHCVTLAHVDPQFAKDQILLMLREWYMHPNGQIAGLRVGLRRREPAGALHGRGRGVRHRAPPDGGRRLRLPRARLPEDAPELHLVGQPEGRAGEQHLPGRLPRDGQHRRVRPRQAPARLPARAGRRHQLDGGVRQEPG